MVRFASEQNFLFKIWRFILVLWDIFILFIASLLGRQPPPRRNNVATTPIPTARGSGFAGSGSYDSGAGVAPTRPNVPGSNVRSLPKFRGVTRMPVGGGG